MPFKGATIGKTIGDYFFQLKAKWQHMSKNESNLLGLLVVITIVSQSIHKCWNNKGNKLGEKGLTREIVACEEELMQLFFDPIKLGEFSTQFFFHEIDKLGKEKDCCKLVPRLQLQKLMSFFLYQFLCPNLCITFL
jgi:hypothetical protein